MAKLMGVSDVLDGYKFPTPKRGRVQIVPGGHNGIKGAFYSFSGVTANRDRALSGLCGFAGLRISEALALTPADVDFSLGFATVRGKGDKTREVPLTPDLLEALRNLSRIIGRGDRFINLSDRGARKFFLRVYGVSSHKSRATAATHLLEATGNIALVKDLLGHEHFDTTMRYLHVDHEITRKAMMQ